MTGIYLHVPFCRRKCPYCDFFSMEGTPSLVASYPDAICRNLTYYGRGQSVDTVYFGGGTPSLLPPNRIADILDTIAKSFTLTSSAEITLECNPATVTEQDLAELRQAGINRLSIGVQALDDMQLTRLGRLHTADQAIQTILSAEKFFHNISADLMIALPHQTSVELQRTLEQLVTLPLTHISAYLLKIEPGTPFGAAHMEKNCPDEDTAADLYLQTVHFLNASGFPQYEISNFAKPGFESQHNLKYWRCEPYLGFGPSAHSCDAGKRFFVPANLHQFLTSPVQPIQPEEGDPFSLSEKVMLGLRLTEGVPVAWFSGKEKKLAQFEQLGLMQISQDRVSFTPEGFLVSNTILADLI